jgi:hypothetical protein
MSPIKHKWRRSAFKCTLTVIGLVLFTAQLSYKFYLCANMPAFHPDGKATQHKTRVSSADPSFPNYQSRQCLLLDKRYDYKHTFALLVPVFRVDHLPQEPKKEFYHFLAGAVAGTVLSISPRGPPVM